MLNKIRKRDLKSYKAKDLMTRHVITLQPSDNLQKAQNLMLRYKIKKIVVVDDNNSAVGILTVKDIIKFLISDNTDRDMHEIPIDEPMTKTLVTVDKNKGVKECAEIADKKCVSSLVIVEDSSAGQSPPNMLAGIITSTDFTRFFSENCVGIATVENYMSNAVFTISINENVSRAAQLIAEKNVSHLVVTATERHGSTLGILSETDISRMALALKSKTIRWVYENIELLFFSSSKRNVDSLVEPALIRIEDIFAPNPTIIEKHADLADAAKVMIRQAISAMPVVESLQEGIKAYEPIGIISKDDIVNALTHI
jgi:CBS domain-containing protein